MFRSVSSQYHHQSEYMANQGNLLCGKRFEGQEQPFNFLSGNSESIYLKKNIYLTRNEMGTGQAVSYKERYQGSNFVKTERASPLPCQSRRQQSQTQSEETQLIQYKRISDISYEIGRELRYVPSEGDFSSNQCVDAGESVIKMNCSKEGKRKVLMQEEAIAPVVPVIRLRRHANARERTRTHSVNDGFIVLRNLIPTEPVNRKLSEIETLRLASSYIWHLNALLLNSYGGGGNVEYFQESTNNNRQLYYSTCTAGTDKICTFCISFLRALHGP